MVETERFTTLVTTWLMAMPMDMCFKVWLLPFLKIIMTWIKMVEPKRSSKHAREKT